MMVELGGGQNPHPRADVVIDTVYPKGAPKQDATKPFWRLEGPFQPMIAERSVDEVYASHFLEHVPKGQPLINVMNEAWRVLKPGGFFTLRMPIVGWTTTAGPLRVDGWWPWADPTHVSHWWFPESLAYFCEGFSYGAEYGILRWAPLGEWIPGERAAMLLKIDQGEQKLLYGGLVKGTWWSVLNGWEGVARLQKPWKP